MYYLMSNRFSIVPGKDDRGVIECERFIVQNFESKLARVLNEEVKMLMEKALQISILCGVTNQPETPGNVAAWSSDQ